MKNTCKLLITILILAAASCTIAQSRTPRHLVKKTVTIGNHERTYHLFVPKIDSSDKKLPVVFVFHGGGGTGLRMERWLKFTDLARRDKFIAVYPQGIGNNWNDGRETSVNRAHKDKIDDLAFVKRMIADIEKEYRVDVDRIFATGPSNGGIFSHYIGAQLSDKFAAIAPVIGGIADPFHKSFKPADPVSVLIIQGTNDKLVPYDGGEIGRNRGRVISTAKTLEMWRTHNNTKSEASTFRLPDLDKRDGSTVETYTWSVGRNGTEVSLYKVIGGGHTWPGGTQYAPRFVVGKVNNDFDATVVIWEFFKSHPKRSE